MNKAKGDSDANWDRLFLTYFLPQTGLKLCYTSIYMLIWGQL